MNMSEEVSQTYDFTTPLTRKVCLPKRVMFTIIGYAPLLGFIINTVAMVGHVILFPYYILVILSRGRPPKFLYLYTYFISAYIYGAIHEKEEVWYDFWILYYIYFGYIVGFIQWILSLVSLALIFPIFIFIEEWELTLKYLYRITFGNWKQIVHECDEMRYKHGMREQQRKEKKARIVKDPGKSKQDGRYHNVDVVEVVDSNRKKTTLTACPTCGESIGKDTTYCPKCGSYVSRD